MARYNEDIVRRFDYYVTAPIFIPYLRAEFPCEGLLQRIVTQVWPPDKNGNSLALFRCPRCDDLNVIQVLIDPTYPMILYDENCIPLAHIQVAPYYES